MNKEAEYILQHGDPRADMFPLMDSPAITVAISAVYVILVKIIGPLWMRNRKPYELRNCMMLYNAALVVLNTWIFVNFASLWMGKYSLRCQSVDYSDEPDARKALVAFYVYYLSKFIEFLDTIFFVLRKKSNQVTFLHLFHHAILPTTSWYFVKYGAGGTVTLFAMVNVFVHIWMYLYYGLSAMGPNVQKFLWWKKYLTSLQLIQFVLNITISGQLLLFPAENCNARNFTVWIVFAESAIFFVLFFKFYNSRYKKKNDSPNNDKYV